MGKKLLVILCLMGSLTSGAQSGEFNLLKNINANRHNGSEGIMEFLSNSDPYIAGAVPLFQLITAYASNDRAMYENGRQSLMALGYAVVLDEVFKYGLQRDRPYVTHPGILDPYKINTDPSLPSGHTSVAFATATSLSLMYPRWYVIAPAYLWATEVGYSRMYLGMHYPTDVLFGAITGAGSAWISWKTNQWLQKRTQSNTLMSY
jgi:membrane-associated phospholipid phosphatase